MHTTTLTPREVAAREPRYVASSDYTIRHDKHAADKILKLLMDAWRDRPGEPVYLTQELGTSDVWAIHTIVEGLRRVGHVIDAERGVAGYVYRGAVPPAKWLHVELVLKQVVRERLQKRQQAAAYYRRTRRGAS